MHICEVSEMKRRAKALSSQLDEAYARLGTGELDGVEQADLALRQPNRERNGEKRRGEPKEQRVNDCQASGAHPAHQDRSRKFAARIKNFPKPDDSEAAEVNDRIDVGLVVLEQLFKHVRSVASKGRGSGGKQSQGPRPAFYLRRHSLAMTMAPTIAAPARPPAAGPGKTIVAHAGSGMSAVRAMAVIARSTPRVLRKFHMDRLLLVESMNRILVSR